MAYVPSSACEIDSMDVPSSSFLLDNTSSSITYLDANNDDEDPPPTVHVPSLAPSPPIATQLPRCVRSTREFIDDPIDPRQTRSQF